MKLHVTVKRGFSHYPWDYMMFIFAAWAIPAIYGLFNRYFIGYMSYESIVTEQSFEALEVIMEVFLEMFPLAVLALVAKDIQNQINVRGIVKTAVVMQLTITIGFATIFVFFAGSFIDWINTPESAKQLALRYFRLRAISLPVNSIAVLFLIAIKALRKGRLAILLAFIGIAVNFILDVLFISNYSFSMRLGLIGSAMDNILAALFSAIMSAIVFLIISKKGLNYRLSKINAISVMAIGKWTGLESLVRNLGYIIGVVALVNLIGANEKSAIGGYNTAMWVMWGITLIPILSWTESTQIAIGNAYGKGDIDAMKGIQLSSTILMGSYMLLWIVIGQIIWEPISKWLNKGISAEIANYSKVTFDYLMIPYALFAIGSGLTRISHTRL